MQSPWSITMAPVSGFLEMAPEAHAEAQAGISHCLQ
jgi:hypothetical protein